MTIRAYISEKLKAYGVTEAQLIDVAIEQGVDLDSDVTDADSTSIGVALIRTLEECIFAPRLSNVSESGFSMSWNYENVGKYYLWLCKKYGLTPNSEIVAMLDIPTIIDRTDNW